VICGATVCALRLRRIAPLAALVSDVISNKNTRQRSCHQRWQLHNS